MALFDSRSDEDPRLEQARMDLLAPTLGSSLGFMAFLFVVVGAVMWGHVHPGVLLSWEVAMFGLTALRLWDARRQAARADRAPDALPGERRRFLLGMLASGALWGTAGMLMFRGDDMLRQCFLAFVLAGICASAVSIYAPHKTGVRGFLCLTLVPHVAAQALQGDTVHYAMAALLLAFLGVLLKFSGVAHASVAASLALRFQNEDLISELTGAKQAAEQINRRLSAEQESVMRIRMLPISFSFNRFPRLARDLSGKLGKSVELRISGEQTELDKTVLEKIGDPLVHLVRNALDHGIEKPDVREAAGKPPHGTLSLAARHEGGNIVIEIGDDGAGINTEVLLAKARERGIVGADETPSEDAIRELIFHPGFSTAKALSDVSGRGVGMDVVRRNITELGGAIDLESTVGVGTNIRIRLPLTLAILDGQLVRVGDQTYIVPLVSIVESLQATPDRVQSVTGNAELYRLRGEYLPIIRLYELFGIPPQTTALEQGLLVVVEGEGRRASIFVDELLGQQQVVIKSLETNYRKVDGISGATILGDGTVAMIIDAGGVIALSRQHQVQGAEHPRAA